MQQQFCLLGTGLQVVSKRRNLATHRVHPLNYRKAPCVECNTWRTRLQRQARNDSDWRGIRRERCCGRYWSRRGYLPSSAWNLGWSLGNVHDMQLGTARTSHGVFNRENALSW
jgi:hypothetical protein